MDTKPGTEVSGFFWDFRAPDMTVMRVQAAEQQSDHATV
jgi:hypothetical protein